MKILFHHIPKTAGSSLIFQLRNQIGQACDGARYDQELSNDKMTSSRYKFYHGHYSFDKVAEFKALNPNSFVFTFIRNPLNRVISHYYNRVDEQKVLNELALVEKRTGDPNIREKRKLYQDEIFGMSLSEFLQSDLKPLKESYKNRHVRYICTKDDFRNNRILALESAKDNLLSFYSMYGLTEFLEISLSMLCKNLNLPISSLDSAFKLNINKNKNVKQYQISKNDMNLIVKHNILDIELYHFAVFQFMKNARLNIPQLDIQDPLKTSLLNGPNIL